MFIFIILTYFLKSIKKKISKYRRKNISNVSKYQIKISKYRNINLGISKYQSIKFKYRSIEISNFNFDIDTNISNHFVSIIVRYYRNDSPVISK